MINKIRLKIFEILGELLKCKTEKKLLKNAVGKMVSIDLLNTGLLQTFNL